MSDTFAIITFFCTIFGGMLLCNIAPKLNKSKSFIVYHIHNVKTNQSKIRLYFNGTNFQSVLAEDYTKEELEKEFVMERINVNLAKEMYNISATTIQAKTIHGDNTTVKAIMLKEKDETNYMPLFRTKEDYDAFLKEIF